MERKKRSIVWSKTKEEIQELLDTCDSYSEVMRRLGLNPRNGSVKTLHARIKKENLDCSNVEKRKWTKQFSRTIPNELVFVENSTTSRHIVKKKIIKSNLIPYVCSGCGNKGKYNNKPLSLQLDHKNGIGNDNRLENLRFLCPNCHSQTETYAGKKKR